MNNNTRSILLDVFFYAVWMLGIFVIVPKGFEVYVFTGGLPVMGWRICKGLTQTNSMGAVSHYKKDALIRNS